MQILNLLSEKNLKFRTVEKVVVQKLPEKKFTKKIFLEVKRGFKNL